MEMPGLAGIFPDEVRVLPGIDGRCLQVLKGQAAGNNQKSTAITGYRDEQLVYFPP